MKPNIPHTETASFNLRKYINIFAGDSDHDIKNE